MPSRKNGQHGRKSLALSIWHDQRSLDRRRYLAAEPGQQALPGALAQRHRLERGLHHVFGPAKGVGQQAVAHAGSGRCSGQGKGNRVGGWQRSAGGDVRRVCAFVVAQPFKQGLAHLLGLLAHLAGLACLQKPVIEFANARQVCSSPGRQRGCDHGQVRARQAQLQLCAEPVGRAGFMVDATPFNSRFQTL